MSKHKPWLQLRSGAAYEYGSFECREMRFEQDIAWPLAHLARFAGHSEHPWSVAAHARVCAEIAYQATGGSSGTALDCLHHDDAEALVGDCPSPLKRLLDGFTMLEVAAESATAFCSGWKVYSDVKKYDLAMLEAERRVLKPIVPTRDWEFPYDEALVQLAIPRINRALDEHCALGQGAYAAYLAADRRYRWQYGDVSGPFDNSPLYSEAL